MDDATTTTCEDRVTVGLDLGDKYTQICALDSDGEVMEEARLRTTPLVFGRRFAPMPAARVVLEAGTHSPWVSRLLTELGHQVIVANPRKLRLIYTNDQKSDRVDAQYLARLGRLDPTLLSPLSHRSAQTEADRALLRSREALVRARTALINHVRGVVKSSGARLPRCGTRVFAREALDRLPEELRPALAPVVGMIANLSTQIHTFDRQIEELVRISYPEAALLGQVPGVGALTALTFVLTIEDPGRFRETRAVGAYLGLRPRQRDSGATQPQLRITKAGNEPLRRLLVVASHYILGPHGPDTDLKRWGLALAERGGKSAKKRAVVAVARKLAVLLLSLWVTGEVYEPLRNARLRGELLPAAC